MESQKVVKKGGFCIMSEQLNSLIKLEDASRFLAEIHSVDEVKAIRDKAEAMRVYAKQARLGLESQNYAAEIKLRAERRAGELLKEMGENGTRVTHENARSNSASEFDRKTLEELGINNKQSSNWQRIAALPEDKFEAHIAGIKASGEELTTASTLTAAAFDYKRDAKSNRAADEYVPQGYDACQTPAYALDPLLPYLQNYHIVWEPACGENSLVETFYDAGWRENEVIASDLLTGQNFFEFEPPQWDCLVTNPPFSLKYKWLERCYQLNKPFALLLPVETLGAKTAQDLMKTFDFEIMLLDSRVDFKMPNKGFDGSAQFPVLWLCWKLLPEKVVFGSIQEGKKAFNGNHE